jgi:hypothetical protein
VEKEERSQDGQQRKKGESSNNLEFTVFIVPASLVDQCSDIRVGEFLFHVQEASASKRKKGEHVTGS